MASTLRHVIAIVCAVLVPASFQDAHAQKAHAPFYKQYNEALSAGDFATAATAGEQAWRAAEGELGDHQTTAILAYNYAALIYFTMPEKAIEPLERVVAISGENDDLFGAEPPGLMLSYVLAAANDDRRRPKARLRKHLETWDKRSSEPTLLSARGWSHIAGYDLGRRYFSNADSAATSALYHYDPYTSDYPREVANTLILRGVSNSAWGDRKREDVVDAVYDFRAAIELFPPQKDIDTFDSLLATAIAWEAGAFSAAHSEVPKKPSLLSHPEPELPSLKASDMIKWDPPHPPHENCQINWKNQPAPIYPPGAAILGKFAGVLIGYHLEGTKVAEARIMAEVPQSSQFGVNALRAVEQWELEKEPAFPECSRNKLMTIYFIIE